MTEKKPLHQSPGQPGKRGFEDLECYQLALEAMAKIHVFSKTLPPDERFDLYPQIRRSAKGVTRNIGEGYSRYHYLDSLHYYSIARGELNETREWLIGWAFALFTRINLQKSPQVYPLPETLASLIDARVLGYIDQVRLNRFTN